MPLWWLPLTTNRLTALVNQIEEQQRKKTLKAGTKTGNLVLNRAGRPKQKLSLSPDLAVRPIASDASPASVEDDLRRAAYDKLQTVWAAHLPRTWRHRLKIQPLEHRSIDLLGQLEIGQFLALLTAQFGRRAVAGMGIACAVAHLKAGRLLVDIFLLAAMPERLTDLDVHSGGVSDANAQPRRARCRGVDGGVGDRRSAVTLAIGRERRWSLARDCAGSLGGLSSLPGHQLRLRGCCASRLNSRPAVWFCRGRKPVSAAICLPVWRCRRNASMAVHVAGLVGSAMKGVLRNDRATHSHFRRGTGQPIWRPSSISC